MSLITAKGSQAAESAAKSSVDLEKVMIRLKDGQSVKVRLLSPEDYVEYQAISAFDLGIFTQPSREPLGEKDYFVEAGKIAKAGKLATPVLNEKFSGLYPKKRYIVAMADVDSKDVRFWDCSKGQFNSLVAAIEDYKEIIEDGDEAVFTFKRTGQKTETSYSLAYIPKPKAPELEGFHSFDGKTVEIADFEAVLQPRTDKLQVSVLKEAGFPVEEFFPEISLDDAEPTESTEETEATTLDGI